MDQHPPLLNDDFPPDPKKWVEFFGGTRLPEPRHAWPRYLLASFGLSPLHFKPARDGHLELQLLYAPSFHPECCITVAQEEDSATVSFVSHCTNLWQWFGHFGDERFAEKLRQGFREYQWPPPPRRCRDAGSADASQFDDFKRSIPQQLPLEVEHKFLDGISLYGEYRSPGGEIAYFSRVGEYDPATFQVARAAQDLASGVLRKPDTQSVLASVRKYF